MEPVQDLAWRAQLVLGTLERFELNSWAVAAVGPEKGLPHAENTLFRAQKSAEHRNSPFSTCRYRLLFFPKGKTEPVYTINMESSILGDWILAEQYGKNHRILEHLRGPLNYEGFRIKALEKALEKLDITEMEK
ncbi:hypothetical protein [Breznakiella homolactica]|uniref:Uncharacterized protein n=1 Tax=Breznakiella homolactica TaxID=2798577 RepID=A0A7T8B8P7_9SPIR|nr:hypothetical protein [Breznakiella homolactica]QQO07536.1 hypothetical protein JFL75_11300 [Breznakiella homolactica]